jgi:hypothetical protein
MMQKSVAHPRQNSRRRADAQGNECLKEKAVVLQLDS